MPEDRLPPADAVYRTEDIKVLPMPNTFFGLLDAIRERPGMYIGRQSLRNFRAWLDGYRFARMGQQLATALDHLRRHLAG